MVLHNDNEDYSYWVGDGNEKIINGYDPPKRPWQVLIENYKSESTCGGTLINQRLWKVF